MHIQAIMSLDDICEQSLLLLSMVYHWQSVLFLQFWMAQLLAICVFMLLCYCMVFMDVLCSNVI